VHKVAKEMPKAEYGVFMTLLQVLNMMTIPAMGLQLVFVQQTVAALARGETRQLTGTVRGVLKVAFILWVVIAGVALIFQGQIAAAYKIQNPAAIWATVAMALVAAVNPVVMGLLQGKMNFLWLGIAAMLNGAGRLIGIAIIVLILGGYAAGAMGGAVIGMSLAVAVAAWHTRDIWAGPSEPIQWRPWLGRVVPLTLGFGTSTVMLSWDMIVVQRFFPQDLTGFYAAAGMIGRALVFLTAPLTAVMFPKVAHSAARDEKSDVLGQALGATALLGGVAALGCTIVPWLPLWIIYDKSFQSVAPLVPWFAWCMLPLTLANVLLNNLLAHRRFEAVPWLIVVALGYAVTLWFWHDSFLRVVQLLGAFAVLFFGVCAFFTWRRPLVQSKGEVAG
jgi:O-antigen/teichoic acid export membrane protein